MRIIFLFLLNVILIIDALLLIFNFTCLLQKTECYIVEQSIIYKLLSVIKLSFIGQMPNCLKQRYLSQDIKVSLVFPII